MPDSNENVIEFISGNKTATVTFTNKKFINRMNKLYQQHPEDFDYFVTNKDGSICCKFPLSWVKISYPRQISEEQRMAASERLRLSRTH